jgi:hypothetical protein
MRPYPVYVNASLDEPLSRWLWLVKWILVIPHVLVLIPLWIGYVVSSIAAWFAIVFTGQYPRGLFDYNVGVMRWTWRVGYYSYGALGTDRYPPFTLADDPNYPARLDVAYPERLSHGLPLVKWLLAIPHLLIIGLLFGGGLWLLVWRSSDYWGWGSGGIVGVLVVIAGIILLFSGEYPRPLFDTIIGLNRYALRVGGYVGLMTDEYPPFRLDVGGAEPYQQTAPGAPVTAAAHRAPSAPRASTGVPWSAGRIVSLVIGSLLALAAMSLFVVGGAGLWANSAYRNADGYLATSPVGIHSSGYAVVAEDIRLPASGPASMYPAALLDRAQIRATASDPTTPVFIGIGRLDQVNAYLSAAPYDVIDDFDSRFVDYRAHPGAAAPTPPPIQAPIWVAQISGTGTQTLNWEVANGDWAIVVMNADARPGVTASASIGATIPGIRTVAIILLAVGTMLLGFAVLLVVLATRPGNGPGVTQPVAVKVPERH